MTIPTIPAQVSKADLSLFASPSKRKRTIPGRPTLMYAGTLSPLASSTGPGLIILHCTGTFPHQEHRQRNKEAGIHASFESHQHEIHASTPVAICEHILSTPASIGSQHQHEPRTPVDISEHFSRRVCTQKPQSELLALAKTQQCLAFTVFTWCPTALCGSHCPEVLQPSSSILHVVHTLVNKLSRSWPV